MFAGHLSMACGSSKGVLCELREWGLYVWLLQVEPEAVELGDHQSRGVNPDASEILHINRKKTLLM